MKKENYRTCACYKNALESVRNGKDSLVKRHYEDPGIEIPLARRREWKYMDPCTTAVFLTDEDVPCKDCPIPGGFVTAPKITPYMTETVGIGISLFANTCKEFGLGSHVINTTGQVWTLTDNINRIVQAGGIIAAVKEAGGKDVLIITDPVDYEEWIRQIESFAELFGRVSFREVKDLDKDEEEQDDDIHVVLADMDELNEAQTRLSREWDMMIVDHARAFIDPTLNEAAYQIGKRAFFRLIIASGRRSEHPRDFYWIYRLADDRIFGDDYDAFQKQYFDRPGYAPDVIDTELWERLSSIGYFVEEMDKGDPFYNWNTVTGHEVRPRKDGGK